MKKIIIIIFLILLVFVVFFLITSNIKYSSNGPALKLTPDKIITDQTMIESIVLRRISPAGNHLENVVLEKQEKGMMDGGWKDAFYVCSADENLGWIRVNSGLKSTLYGPFGWCLI